MSIINKMLQDLDARRSEKTPAEDFGAQIRAVPERRKVRPIWLVAGGLGGVGVIAAAVAAWILTDAGPIGRPQPASPAPVTAQPAPAPVPVASAVPAPPPVAVPAAVPAAAPASAPVPAANAAPPANPAATAQASQPVPVPQAPADFPSIAGLKLATDLNPARLIAAQAMAGSRKADDAKSSDKASTRSSATEGESGRSRKPAAEKPAESEEKPQTGRARSASTTAQTLANASQASPSAQLPQPPAAPGPALHGKEISPQQRTENDYRKAITLMQQGRLADAVTMLEQVLQADPAHAAARQALVGVLVETRRLDEARARAREGLASDPAQPGLAMILARLLLDKGELRSAIETMQRSQSYAADRADYHAFLAALMQRDERHREAVDSYLLALQRAPQNGVWWMGLGISLQAENRQAEAKEAFGKARASGNLSAELTAFVDSRLKLLQR